MNKWLYNVQIYKTVFFKKWLSTGCQDAHLAKSLLQLIQKLNWKIGKFKKSGAHVNDTVWLRRKNGSLVWDIGSQFKKKLRVEKLRIPLLVTFMNCLTWKWQHQYHSRWLNNLTFFVWFSCSLIIKTC